MGPAGYIYTCLIVHRGFSLSLIFRVTTVVWMKSHVVNKKKQMKWTSSSLLSCNHSCLFLYFFAVDWSFEAESWKVREVLFSSVPSSGSDCSMSNTILSITSHHIGFWFPASEPDASIRLRRALSVCEDMLNSALTDLLLIKKQLHWLIDYNSSLYQQRSQTSPEERRKSRWKTAVCELYLYLQRRDISKFQFLNALFL